MASPWCSPACAISAISRSARGTHEGPRSSAAAAASTPSPGNARSRRGCERVFVAPGNAGTALEPRVRNVAIACRGHRGAGRLCARARASRSPSSDPRDRWSRASSIVSRPRDLPCFGPSQAAARLEGSKAFTKDFLQAPRHTDGGLPRSSIARISMRTSSARSACRMVVKADGLAAGKGVVICETHAAAIDAAAGMLGGRIRRRRQHHRDRGVPGRRGGQLHRHGARCSRCCRSPPRRTTSAATTAIAGPTPAAWAPIRRLRSSHRRCTRASCAR